MRKKQKIELAKVNRQARQLKKDDGTLTVDNTEKANLLNNYFCTVAVALCYSTTKQAILAEKEAS